MSNSLVLVLNSGSSSLKFAIIDGKTGATNLTGLAECFGLPEANISWKINGEKDGMPLTPNSDKNLEESIAKLVELVDQTGLKDSLIAVGHRVVQGGDIFKQSTTPVTEKSLADVKSLIDLAPLHNAANAKGIEEGLKLFPNLPQFITVDTGFHQTMPEEAFMYPIPQELYRDLKIRRYGAHGTSHYFVSQEAAKMLGKKPEDCNFITCHLGNGGSISAIKHGECIDTSMGLTPLAGVMMGTRSGDIDPSIYAHLMNHGWTSDEVFTMLNKKSGLLGISGKTSDFRGIADGYAEGDKDCTLAFKMFTYRVAKYIGSYLVAIGEPIDGLVFTGGIGENSRPMREDVISRLAVMGYEIDKAKNDVTWLGEKGTISKKETPWTVVIPTNEEFVIAQQSLALVEAAKK